MAWSIAVLDTFQVKFLHSREVVANNKMCTHLYTQKLIQYAFYVHLDVVIRWGEFGYGFSFRAELQQFCNVISNNCIKNDKLHGKIF